MAENHSRERERALTRITRDKNLIEVLNNYYTKNGPRRSTNVRHERFLWEIYCQNFSADYTVAEWQYRVVRVGYSGSYAYRQCEPREYDRKRQKKTTNGNGRNTPDQNMYRQIDKGPREIPTWIKHSPENDFIGIKSDRTRVVFSNAFVVLFKVQRNAHGRYYNYSRYPRVCKREKVIDCEKYLKT